MKNRGPHLCRQVTENPDRACGRRQHHPYMELPSSPASSSACRPGPSTPSCCACPTSPRPRPGQDVGLRCPATPAHALLACQRLDPPVWGVAAPTPMFGKVSSTTAEHVAGEALVRAAGAGRRRLRRGHPDHHHRLHARGIPVLLRPTPSRALTCNAANAYPKEEQPSANSTMHPAHFWPITPRRRACRWWTPNSCRPGWTCWAPTPPTWPCTPRAALRSASSRIILRRMPDDAAARRAAVAALESATMQT